MGRSFSRSLARAATKATIKAINESKKEKQRLIRIREVEAARREQENAMSLNINQNEYIAFDERAYVLNRFEEVKKIYEMNKYDACSSLWQLVNESSEYVNEDMTKCLEEWFFNLLELSDYQNESISIILQTIEYYQNGNVKAMPVKLEHQDNGSVEVVSSKDFYKLIEILKTKISQMVGEWQAKKLNREYELYCESLETVLDKCFIKSFSPNNYLVGMVEPVLIVNKPKEPQLFVPVEIPSKPENLPSDMNIIEPDKKSAKYKYDGKLPKFIAVFLRKYYKGIIKEKEDLYWEEYDEYENKLALREKYHKELNDVNEKNGYEKKRYEEDLERYKKEKKHFDVLFGEYQNKLKEYTKSKENDSLIIQLIDWYTTKNADGLPMYFKYFLDLNKQKFENNLQIKLGEISFDEDDVLIVDFFMPETEMYKKLKDYKYIKSRDEITWKEVPNKIYSEQVITSYYSLYLAVLVQLFEIDYSNLLKGVVLNAYTTLIDTRLGKHEEICIMSAKVSKAMLSEINFDYIVPKDTFRFLKGKGVPNPDNILAIQPLRFADKDKYKIIESGEVLDSMSSNTNLAAMDWQDFEVLTKDVFTKEFAEQDIVIKNTQPSNDGGIDVIAFNRNPYSGGIIVLQAKRYTNIVTPEPVRALKGTMQDVNAVRGILVTTSDFGKSSYEFASQNNITLINGDQLLQLLQKHGYNMHIDLVKAKALNTRR